MTPMDWNEIPSELKALLAKAGEGLPRDDRENVASFIRSGEYGVAFETLCTQMYEYDVRADRDDRARFAAIGQQLELDPSLWEVLAD